MAVSRELLFLFFFFYRFFFQKEKNANFLMLFYIEHVRSVKRVKPFLSIYANIGSENKSHMGIF